VEDRREIIYRERVRGMERRVASLQRVIRVTEIINSTLELAPLLDMIVQVATELTDTTSASIMLMDKETGELRFKAVTGQDSAEVKSFAVPLEGSIAGTVVHENKPLLIRDAQADPRWCHDVDEGSGFVTRSIIAVPLQVRGQTIGVVEALNKSGGTEMTWEDVQLLTMLANQAAIAIENARLLSALQEAYASLNELDRLKSDFIAVAAHELRTPLSVILGYAMFLKDDASGTTKEQLDIVLQSAMRLRSLIDDMVNLREVDAGEAVLELEEFSVQVLISGAVEEICSLAEAKEQRVSVHLPGEPLMIEADRKKMNIVAVNLLSNAVKFTGEGGRVGVQAGRNHDSAWFTVWDTGIGISPSHLDRIFDRFYQVEPSLVRQHGGLGLGLAIAKEMLDLHHGVIMVESLEGKGSAFTVTVPTRQPK
jgi:signal transduction histidine kinase